MKIKTFLCSLAFASIIGTNISSAQCHSTTSNQQTPTTDKTIEKNYLKAKKLVKINDEYSFKYNFASKPKIGTAILKIELEQNGKKTDILEITGNYDMPSMRGAHPSGDVKFQTNKKQEYLLPVSIVMPGVWEVDVTFKEGEEQIYQGTISIKI